MKSARPVQGHGVLTDAFVQALEAIEQAGRLDVYLRALIAEVTRQAAVIEDVNNWSVPTLLSFEKELQKVVNLTVSNVANTPNVK